MINIFSKSISYYFKRNNMKEYNISYTYICLYIQTPLILDYFTLDDENFVFRIMIQYFTISKDILLISFLCLFFFSYHIKYLLYFLFFIIIFFFPDIYIYIKI